MNTTSQIFLTKLNKLEQQLHVAKLADFVQPHGEDAVELLMGRLKRAAERIDSSEQFSPATRLAILQEANFWFLRITNLIGIIIRSGSVRNPFELYLPFLDVCQALVGSDARLLLSSEWQFVPFTYPQSLIELPNFIIIGLPASESDNVLVFPAAGHELGHTVWLKHELRQTMNAALQDFVHAAFRDNRPKFDQTFPTLKGVDLDQDLFVQQVKAEVFDSAMAQAEELFSDFIALLIFGESYLFAFQYLLAPSLPGLRSREYPDIHRRAEYLAEYSHRHLAISEPSYADAFSAQRLPSLREEKFILEISDGVLATILPSVFAAAQKVVTSSSIATPTEKATLSIEKVFNLGVPYDGDASIGDLVNAAWRIFRLAEGDQYARQGRVVVEYVSDLVFKSVEIYELRKYMAG